MSKIKPKKAFQKQLDKPNSSRINIADIKLNSLPLVEVDPELWDEPDFTKYKNKRFIVLGEITQMPGHVTMVDIKSGDVIPVFHTFDLLMLTPEEV